MRGRCALEGTDRLAGARARTPTSWCSMRGATPQMALRMETVETLANELFLLQTCGDDRAVVETYVMGKPMKIGACGRS